MKSNRNQRQKKSVSHLKSPSGSKGAWHQEGASGGNGPESGELMLHSYWNLENVQTNKLGCIYKKSLIWYTFRIKSFTLSTNQV